MSDTAVCPYQDAQLARLWREANERGDFKVYNCCGHIKYHHKEFVCILCVLSGKACPMLPKQPEKKSKKDDERKGPCQDPRCEFWTDEEKRARSK